jgi:hypothetical protein
MRRLNDGTAWTEGWTTEEVNEVAKVVTHIQLVPETEGVDIGGALQYPIDVDTLYVLGEGQGYREAMNPQQIVEALIQLDEDDLDDVMKGLQSHYDAVVGTE